MKTILTFLIDDTASTAVEYAVVLSLIVMVAYTAIASFGTGTGSLWGGIRSDLQEANF